MDGLMACRGRRAWPAVSAFSINLVSLDLYGDDFVFEMSS